VYTISFGFSLWNLRFLTLIRIIPSLRLRHNARSLLLTLTTNNLVFQLVLKVCIILILLESRILYLLVLSNIWSKHYEARTPLRLGVLRCPTRVGLLWHMYDTCRTGVLNNWFFIYFDTPATGVRHLYNIHTSRVRQLTQISKTIFFLSCFHTL